MKHLAAPPPRDSGGLQRRPLAAPRAVLVLGRPALLLAYVTCPLGRRLWAEIRGQNEFVSPADITDDPHG